MEGLATGGGVDYTAMFEAMMASIMRRVPAPEMAAVGVGAQV